MNDMSEAPPPNVPRIWAHKGEAITCINGHAICDLARDIYLGEPRQGDHFTNWRQPEPHRSCPVGEIRCTECRGVWIRGNPQAGYQFRFGAPPHGEWR